MTAPIKPKLSPIAEAIQDLIKPARDTMLELLENPAVLPDVRMKAAAAILKLATDLNVEPPEAGAPPLRRYNLVAEPLLAEAARRIRSSADKAEH